MLACIYVFVCVYGMYVCMPVLCVCVVYMFLLLSNYLWKAPQYIAYVCVCWRILACYVYGFVVALIIPPK